MEIYVEGRGVAHLIPETEREICDHDAVIGEAYETEEGLDVIYNDGSNMYSVLK